jgi:xanthine dehydrogenase YagR molybdenum-binding subunit
VRSWPDKATLIGTPIKRLDGPAKVSGRAKFTYDIKRPGMLYGVIVRSPHAYATIKSIDVSAAEKAPGVKATNLVMQVGAKVMYAGMEVAAVAATTEELARDAARLIKVDYDVLEPITTPEQAMRPDTPVVFAQRGNAPKGNPQVTGDVEAGFTTAAHIVEATYSTQVQTHNPLETHGSIAEWDGDKLTVWASTQGVHSLRNELAAALQTPVSNIRVMADYVGGGFGNKLGADLPAAICARLAKAAGAPVQLMLDRKGEHLVMGNRPSAYAKIRAGVAADGTLVAIDAQTWGAGQGSSFPLPYPIYVFKNSRRVHTDAYINAGTQRSMRAPGHPQGCFITEVLIDELADGIKMDPLALRVKNLPAESPTAMWGKYFKMGAEQFGWSKRHAFGDTTPGPLKRGMGCAANTWAGAGSLQTRGQCEIAPDGSVSMRIGTQDIGTGTRTVIAIVTAETFGLPLSGVKADIGDTNLPYAPGSGGSVTVASVSSTARATAEKALAALAEKIAPGLGVAAADIVAVNGRLQSKIDPAKNISWKDACKQLGAMPMVIEGQFETTYGTRGTSGVQFADVTVDVETGVTKINHIVCVQDAGRVIDRMTAESQVYGGITMGIGYALFENRILDRNTGNMVNPNMEFYLLPGPSDIPKIDVTLVDQPDRGVVGLGEPPTISTAAAIGNAVANAIGARVRSLPLTPDKVLAALSKA